MGPEVQLGAQIVVIVGAVAYFTRLTVDLVRMYRQVSLGLVLLMLVVVGPVFALAFYLSSDPTRTVQGITQSVAASIVLGGFLGVAGAIAGNAAAAKAQPTNPPATEPATPGGV